MKRPLAIWPLLILLLFLGIGGLYGGIIMLADPTDEMIQLKGVLPLLPVKDFTCRLTPGKIHHDGVMQNN